jgi:predicted DNA-binding transcriptional regulator YafY
MAKKRRPRPGSAARAVTAERAARLHRLLTLLAAGSQTRDGLRRQLKMDVRSFYRDLELLRAAGIMVPLRQGHYSLSVKAEAAYRLLPFPDPHLTLGEAVQLARGTSPAHRKLKKLISQIVATKQR